MRRNLPASPGRELLADLRSHGYFYYSLLLCCYSAMFATTVFFVPYYVEPGYSNSRIGIIMAANSAMASVFPPLPGLLSDKLRSARKPPRLPAEFSHSFSKKYFANPVLQFLAGVI